MRTGSEPVTARSALRMRFWLSVWGVLWTSAGTALFALADHPGWAALCGALLLVVLVDLVIVVRHLRQGPHFQPGRDIPPYEPVHDRPLPPRPPESGAPPP
ncbi:DUF6343 family protein [Streptomyces clavuligerus]|uniref:DUF6343 family protein n=1 Tax=Streptomyces clavuligerus TaxID=1901 RepID=UPI0001800333|nr:DUF6343 family protein [Streptomyces clavuligerus]ANW20717.1 hypothetical protein BB341_22165 [Streptomyces clavuligerus]AXU15344.1 hypothetical protein D1794_23055 [Streptomyces clavuligerus]EDY51058.1 integral membrane protein [Streptomyces clavuligerus]MBY6305433.1 hypothetical protein [Streptomyces clavuligerus]QCS08120.1 hypothetical protein CRV15_22420 [Streptomyces clavuligerus]